MVVKLTGTVLGARRRTNEVDVEGQIVELEEHFPIRVRTTSLRERIFHGKGKEEYLTLMTGQGLPLAYILSSLILYNACNLGASRIRMVPDVRNVEVWYTINGQERKRQPYPLMGPKIEGYEGLHAEIIHGLKRFVGLSSMADIQVATGEVSINSVPYKMTIGTEPAQYGLRADINLEKRV